MLDVIALEEQIREGMHAAQVPGLALAVLHEAELIYRQGFGVTSVEPSGIPVTPDTMFRIGSITKPLTATYIAMHVGRKNLERPLAHRKQHRQTWHIAQQHAEEQISLKMLLSHTAGIGNDLRYFGQHDLWHMVNHLPLEFAPTTAYQYSNLGICLAALYTARRFDFITRFLFAVLQMRRTTFYLQDAITYPLALPHVLDDDQRPYVLRPFIDCPPYYACGFAMSTVLDLANFARLHLNGGRFNGVEWLAPETIDLMHSVIADRLTANRMGYGLCFRSYDYKGVRLIGHNGAIGKYGGWFWLHPPSKSAVIMLVNRAPQFWGAGAAIVNSIFDQLLGLPAAKPALEFSANSGEFYSGTYLGWETGLVRTSSENGIHYAQLNAENPIAVYPLRENVFASANGAVSVGFATPDKLYYNGNLCQRGDYALYDGEIDSTYQGVYKHDIDTFTLRIADNVLYVYSADDRAEYRCWALSPTRFVSDLGVLDCGARPSMVSKQAHSQFTETKNFITWGNAFQFKCFPTKT
jgi:CubicO group peptidase (beta-lactamase class C family)